jgi:hypothetical protein
MRHSKRTVGKGKFLVDQTLLLWFSLFLVSCGIDMSDDVADAYQKMNKSIDFNLDIRPILSDKCFSCHGPDKTKVKAGLRLDDELSAKADLPENLGKKAIVPGNLSASMLAQRILSEDPELVMPPADSKLILNAREKAMLLRWIEDGAKYKPHWAFIPPQKTSIPEGQDPIDFLITNRLEEEGLQLSREADKEALLRRLSFDLTGLPPTIEEMDAFLNDRSPEAYEKQVDRLMGSPYYGERMATEWMDVARYADTHGYTVDRFRDVSPWRDWVIKSFNDNMAYDKFFTMQLAGDLMPDAGREERIATTFLRLHPQNMEGGIVPEEFRVEYVVDRTNTFGTAFMGMTMGCAKCHDHKFDPLSQREYFQLFSFFNNLNEAGQISFDNMMPVPTLLLTDQKQDSIIDFLNFKIDSINKAKVKAVEDIKPDFSQWLSSESYKSIRAAENKEHLVGKYLLNDNLLNKVGSKFEGQMRRNNSNNEKPIFAPGHDRLGLKLDGDAWLDLDGAGAFERYQTFSFGLWVKLPADLRDGVIFHKGIGAALYNFKGFHLALKDNRLELLMAHTTPYNAIIEYADVTIPRDQWVHLAVTYDGSSSAKGLRLFMQGQELLTEVENDNLYKGILFNEGLKGEPGIQIGARWRGKGIGGAVVDDLVLYDTEITALEVLEVANPDMWKELISKEVEQLERREIDLLSEYFVKYFCRPIQDLDKSHLRMQKERSLYVEKIPELMVYEEMQRPRPTYILDRGAYDSPTQQVQPNTPKAIMAIDTSTIPLNRLDLAQWLADPAHPLTARVMVNRMWQQFFGKGLVSTSEDFGSQGSYPSHPALLDHLAVLFQENSWDIKHMQKMILMSKTYRQTSIVEPSLLERDPKNVLYARGPSRRLSAEMLRDQVLAASGLLNRKIGGKSVHPYQPEGLWKVNGASYVQSEGDDLYRRSLYTVWKRSVPHPTQSTFDAPERNECVMRRQETNTPLQALVLMNDPIFVEAAINLGKEMAQNNNIKNAFRKLTGRNASEEEIGILEDLFQIELEKYQKFPDKSSGWRPDVKNDPESLRVAAYAVVASTIINSDASITKR